MVDDTQQAVVVVTAMPLSDTARADLSELLGRGYAVVDIKAAPETANIVLTPVISAQLLGTLRRTFPDARILFTELDDHERGIRFTGPLSRIVAQAPDGYFVAHTLDALSPVVKSEAALQLQGGAGPTPLSLRFAPDRSGTGPAEPAAGYEERTPEELAHAPAGAETTTVHWVEDASQAPPGRWVDLGPLDALVARVARTDDPRRDPLWPALVAECAVIVARDDDDVLVDVGGLDVATRVELQVRVASEQVDQQPAP